MYIPSFINIKALKFNKGDTQTDSMEIAFVYFHFFFQNKESGLINYQIYAEPNNFVALTKPKNLLKRSTEHKMNSIFLFDTFGMIFSPINIQRFSLEMRF
jgi:hypothetical protein